MPERLPKLPKLPELTKLQALLLLGGAFVFAALAWGAARYDVFTDRTLSAPETAVFAATVDRTSPDWAAFEASLPEGPRQALAVAADMKDPTLFAVRGEDGALQWGTVEALSVRTGRSGLKRLRIVPKGASAVGFVELGGRAMPFTAYVEQGLVRADVGMSYRGLNLGPGALADHRRMIAPMHAQTAYLEKPPNVSWSRISDLFEAGFQRYRGQAGLWDLPGRIELSSSASGTGLGLSPFVLYYRPASWSGAAIKELEAFSREVLAEAGPVGFEVALPDGSLMTEFRFEPDAVRSVRKEVREYGHRLTLSSPEGNHAIEAFFNKNGEAWLSTDLDLIQAALTGSIGSSLSSSECETGGRGGYAEFSGSKAAGWPYFEAFERLTVSIHNLETGLFTICGYIAP